MSWMPAVAASQSNDASARSIGRSAYFAIITAISASAAAGISCSRTLLAGMTRVIGSDKMTREQMAGFGQHRPCGEQLAIAAIKVTVDAGMRVIAPIEERDQGRNRSAVYPRPK